MRRTLPSVKSLSRRQRLTAFVAAALFIAGTAYLGLNFSLMVLILIGVPGALAYLLWYATYLREPLDPAVILPAFLFYRSRIYVSCDRGVSRPLWPSSRSPVQLFLDRSGICHHYLDSCRGTRVGGGWNVLPSGYSRICGGSFLGYPHRRDFPICISILATRNRAKCTRISFTDCGRHTSPGYAESLCPYG